MLPLNGILLTMNWGVSQSEERSCSAVLLVRYSTKEFTVFHHNAIIVVNHTNRYMTSSLWTLQTVVCLKIITVIQNKVLSLTFKTNAHARQIKAVVLVPLVSKEVARISKERKFLVAAVTTHCCVFVSLQVSLTRTTIRWTGTWKRWGRIVKMSKVEPHHNLLNLYVSLPIVEGRGRGGRGAVLTYGCVVWSLFRSCASQTTRSYGTASAERKW